MKWCFEQCYECCELEQFSECVFDGWFGECDGGDVDYFCDENGEEELLVCFDGQLVWQFGYCYECSEEGECDGEVCEGDVVVFVVVFREGQVQCCDDQCYDCWYDGGWQKDLLEEYGVWVFRLVVGGFD